VITKTSFAQKHETHRLRNRLRNQRKNAPMKTLLYLLVALAVATPGHADNSDRRTAKEKFVANSSELQKWKKGQPLPESLADAGLLADAIVVWSGLYSDGGTNGYLLRDSVGNFLAFCTGPGFQSKDHPKRIDAALGSRLFVGALHYARAEAEIVPVGSKTEEWLKERIQRAQPVRPANPAARRSSPEGGMIALPK
jgi:hypothetical protein